MTHYEPFDGDYIEADYGKLVDEIQENKGIDIGPYPEICVSVRQDNKIEVLGSNTDEEDWEDIYLFDIPKTWDLKLIQDMFVGNVYMQVVGNKSAIIRK